MKKLLLILLFLPSIGFGQPTLKTYVPDDNFENYLEANGMGDGIQLNDSINFWAIEMLISLDVRNQNISDLTGIEDFTVLTILRCDNNQLTSLDVSNNTYLTDLYCDNNQLTSLDLSQNINLEWLKCVSNQITSLDLSHNNALYFFNIGNNPFTCLNIANGNSLNFSDCGLWNTPNLYCIEVDNYTNVVGINTPDPQTYYSDNCNNICSSTPSSIQEKNTNKEFLKKTDLLGRETKQTNQPLLYLYDDGTVEKKIVIE